MKRNLLFLLLFSIACLVGWAQPTPDNPEQWATEEAEDNPPLRLGFSNTYFNTYYTKRFYEQTDQAHEFGAAIYLSPQVLAKYRGAQIKSVHFALWEEVGEHYTVFVARELGDATHPTQPISRNTVRRGNFHQGWNAVGIDPVTISGNEGLYIGWIGAVSAAEAMHGNFTLDHTKGQFEANCNYFMDAQGRWYPIHSDVNLNLMIRGYADGDNLPTSDIALSKVDGPDIIWQNRPTTYDVTMTNYGMDYVMSVDVELLSDGKVYDNKHFASVDLDHNERITLPLSGISFPDEGNHSLAFRVTQVNGNPDSDPSDNELSRSIFAVPEGAEPYPRNILFEEMTSELDMLAPKADYVFNAAVQDRKEQVGNEDVIWVKHHIDGIGKRKNGDPWDTYATEYDPEYKRFYEGYPMQGCDFLPAVVVDRNIINGMEEKAGVAYFVTDELALGGLFNLCQQMPAYIQVTPTVDYNAATRQLSIDVDAEARLTEMIQQTDLRLTVYVVEDSLMTYIQRYNGDSEEFMLEIIPGTSPAVGKFVQNGVIRAYPAGVWGDKVEIENLAIHRHYDVALDESWNPQNMRVVAFVHNYDANAQTGNNVVYNAGQTFIGTTNGIEEISSLPSPASSPIYDLQGRRVEHPAQGLYIRNGRVEIR